MSTNNKPAVAFWIIGIAALLWNLMGVANYLMQAFKVEAVMAEMTDDQMALLESLPAWMTALFAIAVFSGALGCIALLMRKGIAVKLFMISFIAATIQQLYWVFGTDAIEVFSESMPYLMPILIIIVCVFLVWYSKDQKAKGIIS